MLFDIECFSFVIECYLTQQKTKHVDDLDVVYYPRLRLGTIFIHEETN